MQGVDGQRHQQKADKVPRIVVRSFLLAHGIIELKDFNGIPARQLVFDRRVHSDMQKGVHFVVIRVKHVIFIQARGLQLFVILPGVLDHYFGDLLFLTTQAFDISGFGLLPDGKHVFAAARLQYIYPFIFHIFILKKARCWARRASGRE